MQNELENAFDDLADEYDDDDDDQDNDSVSYVMKNRKSTDAPNVLYNGIATNHHQANPNKYHDDTELMNEVLHLKNMLSSKNQELKNLTSEFTNERITLQNKIEELTKRLTITDSDKERAHMGKQQLHELLIESKQQVSQQDGQITDLNAKIGALDAHNLELLAELERTKSLLNEAQHKYHMIEKNAAYSSERHTDNMVKQINDRHAAQIDMMQQQINTMCTKLEDKDNEIKRLQIQNHELHKSRETMLLDESDSIKQLSKRLDESQRQCQELMRKYTSSGDLAQENARLMRTVNALEQQTHEMQQTISSLTLRYVFCVDNFKEKNKVTLCY